MPPATPSRDGDAIPLGLAIQQILNDNRVDQEPDLASTLTRHRDNDAGVDQEPDLAGIPTGFRDYDTLTRGLQPGHLSVVAGRPSAGKSMLATDLARSCSIKHGKPSVIFTVGATISETTTQILCAEALVTLPHMRNGPLSDEDLARINSKSVEISAAPLFIVDGSDLTATKIMERCERLHDRRGIKLAIIDFIDGLPPEPQPFATDDEDALDLDNLSEVSEISKITRPLKLLAIELNIHIVAFVQLPRLEDGQIETELILDSLRDCDSIAGDADVVVLLHRNDLSDPDSPRAGEADLTIAKHRRGPTSKITVAFQEAYGRFVDMAQN